MQKRNAELVRNLRADFVGRDEPRVRWFNILNYDVAGDGVTDDSTAIQNAIDIIDTIGGGVIYFPSNRTYLVSSTITLADNVQIVGDGPNSIIKHSSSTGVIFAAGSGVSNVRIANLMLEGVGAASAGSNHYGIRIRSSSNVLIERVWAHGFRAGISFYGDTTSNGNVNVTIQDCYCYNNLLHGIFCIIDQDRILIENNYCYHNGGWGIVLDDSSSGTAVQAPKLNIVRGNVCRDNTGGGIILEGGRETIVSGNQCFENGTNTYYSQSLSGYGIELGNSQNDVPSIRNIVSDNVCYLNRLSGIFISGSSLNIIHDNILEDNGNGSSVGRGITIANVDGPIGSNRNKIHDNYIYKISAVDMVIGIRINDSDCFLNEIYNNTIYDATAGTWTAISDVGTDTRLGFNEGNDPAQLTFADGDTTPSVQSRRSVCRFANTSATNVTGLDDGLELQEVVVFSSNANTTLKDISTTGTFHLVGSVDYTIPGGGWLRFVFWGGAWRELSRSAT